MMLCIVTVFSSCEKEDDENEQKEEQSATTVEITVKSNGIPKAGIPVCMFSTTTASIGFYKVGAQKTVATDSDGIATFELNVGTQTTFYFVAFPNNATSSNGNENQAVLTIKPGETKSAIINIGGNTTYDNKGNNVGTVSIKHNSSSTYNVYIDDKLIDTWTKSGTYSYEVTANVRHTIKVEQKNGYLFSPTKGTKTFTVGDGENVFFSGPVSNTSTEYFN